MSVNSLPSWEAVLSAAARFQDHFPEAVLVGGTAVSLFAGHRRSYDNDHTFQDLTGRFEEVLGEIEHEAGWHTNRVKPPVLILGQLHGVETGIRQLRRSAPLDTQTITLSGGEKVTVPTPEETLRIKAYLAVRRNATRDYLDFAALSAHLGEERVLQALARLDALYPQNDDPAGMRTQIMKQLAEPLPYDLDEVDLSSYKAIQPPWNQWGAVKAQCTASAQAMMEAFARQDPNWAPAPQKGAEPEDDNGPSPS
jgi:hypothetical protein